MSDSLIKWFELIKNAIVLVAEQIIAMPLDTRKKGRRGGRNL